MEPELQSDIDVVASIAAVPTILEVVCRTTGMRFAAVARVTPERWIACSVLDEIDFGLKAGGELQLQTTICNEIRQSLQPVVIEHVAEEAAWCNHATPLLYGFQSYISMPILLTDGSFFGTLCAIDPRPARIKTAETIGMFRLFAELIAKHLDAARKLSTTETALREQRHRLEETEGSLHEFERSNEALQRFASIAAHDLREPLRQVSTFTQLLAQKHKDFDPESQQMFEYLRAGASRMGKLLDGLMAYTQIDALHATVLETADLEACLEEALQGLRLSLQEADAVVTHGSLPQVPGNPAQLAQLLQNLLGNAIKYRGEQSPRIHVFADRRERDWMVAVRDNGIGVPPEYRTKIFEVFARLHGPEIDGAGLGLAFCSKIVELHRGQIWVESNDSPQGGSVFYFSLPAL